MQYSYICPISVETFVINVHLPTDLQSSKDQNALDWFAGVLHAKILQEYEEYAVVSGLGKLQWIDGRLSQELVQEYAERAVSGSINYWLRNAKIPNLRLSISPNDENCIREFLFFDEFVALLLPASFGNPGV